MGDRDRPEIKSRLLLFFCYVKYGLTKRQMYHIVEQSLTCCYTIRVCVEFMQIFLMNIVRRLHYAIHVFSGFILLGYSLKVMVASMVYQTFGYSNHGCDCPADTAMFYQISSTIGKHWQQYFSGQYHIPCYGFVDPVPILLIVDEPRIMA